ncbi:MAG: IS200/IS605 family element transposase accessory protein TnpB [Deinococcus sp.]|nr:IS200/IS605 family element transposase accessory protein TnpB [Deinococcus sp.]
MKLTARVKLQPLPEQRRALLSTLRQVNAACNAASAWAWQHRTFRQFDIHQGMYYPLKARFGLAAQMVVRAIAKVTDAYKLDRTARRTFTPLGAIAYDERVLSWKLGGSTVSIWTVAGRQTIPFVCSDYQRRLLASQQGETDLAYVGGECYLFSAVNVEEPEPIEVEGILGVDLGVVNIATDSDGEAHSGSHLNNLRRRHRRLRRKLQQKGTPSARRRLKQRSGKEARFAKNVNHHISKVLVAKAERTKRAIALEDLQGIRSRIRARRPQRATLHSWAFHDLKQKMLYKARRAGVPVMLVDPRNTSRTCPSCGSIARGNRPTQTTFCCVSCGLAGPADTIAAENIRRAALNQPNAGPSSLHPLLPASPRLQPWGS